MSESNGSGKGILYRILGFEENGLVAPIFAEKGVRLPHPKLMTAAIAETAADGIVGGGILQMTLHMEPWWVKEGWRGHVNIPRLHHMLEERAEASHLFPGYLVTTTDETSTGLAPLVGLTKIPNATLRGKG